MAGNRYFFNGRIKRVPVRYEKKGEASKLEMGINTTQSKFFRNASIGQSASSDNQHNRTISHRRTISIVGQSAVRIKCSKIFQGVPARGQDIPFYIHPESKDKINDQRRPHRKERDIDKPGPDPGGGNTHSFSNGCTYTKHLPFDKVFESVHIANIKKNDKTIPKIARTIPILCYGYNAIFR
jgi:hypothetical protein